MPGGGVKRGWRQILLEIFRKMFPDVSLWIYVQVLYNLQNLRFLGARTLYGSSVSLLLWSLHLACRGRLWNFDECLFRARLELGLLSDQPSVCLRYLSAFYHANQSLQDLPICTGDCRQDQKNPCLFITHQRAGYFQLLPLSRQRQLKQTKGSPSCFYNTRGCKWEVWNVENKIEPNLWTKFKILLIHCQCI